MKKIISLLFSLVLISELSVTAQSNITYKNVIDSSKTKECDEIFTYVEQMPQYPGGESEMTKFIEENIQYPLSAQDSGLQGSVYVRFIVSDIGVINHVEILRSFDDACSVEAKRVIKSMPLWKSGKQNGRPVCVYYTLPIRFTLK